MGFLRNLFGSGPTAASFIERASSHAENGNFDQAVAVYGEGIAALPEDAELRLCRGQVYRDMGDHERAAEDFAAAMRLDEKGTMSRLFWCGQRWGEQEEHNKEIAEYDVALRLDPSFALAYGAPGSQ
jgi:tetratricopeptide (TPR) repeat protein